MKALSDSTGVDAVFRVMSESEYRPYPAINSSGLSVILDLSPRHFIHRRDNPVAPTPAMVQGTLFHLAVLEPDVFEQTVLKGPDCDKRNKAWKEFEAAHAGKQIVEPEIYDRILRMRSAAMEDKEVEMLVAESLKERVGIWRDSEYDVDCKMKVDGILLEQRIIWDLKTTDCAKASSFAKSVKNFGYHRQNSFYLRGCAQLGFPMRAAVNVVVEKNEPHGVAVYLMDENVKAQGDREVRAGLDIYSRCLRENNWFCYGSDWQPLPFPAWGYSNE